MKIGAVKEKPENQGHEFEITDLNLECRLSPELHDEIERFVVEALKLTGLTNVRQNPPVRRITGCNVRNDVCFPHQILLTPFSECGEGKGQYPTIFCEVIDGKIILPADCEGMLYLEDLLRAVSIDSQTDEIIREAQAFDKMPA